MEFVLIVTSSWVLDPDDCSATNTSETAEWDSTFLRLMKLKMTNVNFYIESICKSQTQAPSPRCYDSALRWPWGSCERTVAEPLRRTFPLCSSLLLRKWWSNPYSNGLKQQDRAMQKHKGMVSNKDWQPLVKRASWTFFQISLFMFDIRKIVKVWVNDDRLNCSLDMQWTEV